MAYEVDGVSADGAEVSEIVWSRVRAVRASLDNKQRRTNVSRGVGG